ncbi:MAG: 50S ribosome-binding GTPase [Deltaproteobacteria bacterium]|nr:50S ribosome-binding GTPase [Deltaproteobacteria bacterium]
MPANLSPEYKEAEQRYRSASSWEDKLHALEDMLAGIPKHKGTEKMQADIKSRIARMRDEGPPKAKAGGRSQATTVDREAVAMAMLLGPPNAGKSALLRAVSKAQPEVAPYPYTTQLPCSGIAYHEDVPMQFVDLPPLSAERPLPWVIGQARNADVLLLVVDLAVDPLSELHESERLLEEARLFPCRDPALADEAIRPRAKPAAIVATKLDAPNARENLEAFRELYEGDLPVFPVSAQAGEGLAELTAFVFRTCRLLRVYAKQPGKPPDLDQPFVLHEGDTVALLCERIHKDFAQNLKFARIWGAHTFEGQRVIADYVLHDKDVVELHL